MFTLFESLVRPFPSRQPNSFPSSVRAYLWSATEGFRVSIAVLIGLRAVVGALEATLFAMLGQVVNWLILTPKGELWTLHQSDLIVLGILLMGIPALSALQTLVKHQTLSGNLPARLRWNFHRLILEQEVAFFQREMAGRIAERLMSVARATKDCCVSLIELGAFVAVYLVTMLSISASFDIQLVVPFVVWLVLYASLVMHAIPRMDRASCNEARTRSGSLGWLVDTYSHIQTVKLFDQQGAEQARAKESMSSHLDATRFHERQVSAFVVANQLLGYSLLLAVAWLALSLWNRSDIGVGGVAAACAMALRLTGMSQWLLWEASAVFEDIGTIRDGLETVARKSLVTDVPGARTLTVSKGEIVFQHVSFAYADGSNVLKDFSLRIKSGERVAIVGPSGEGKSSLFNLLLRLYTPQVGSIYIDGQDIASVQQTSLRGQIGVVAQDAALMHRSVFDNIAYGRHGASGQEVAQAARLAHAHDFIESLQDSHGGCGFNASIGARGSNLSGGQRQRLAIARAILKDAPILLLDEATSALDIASEQSVLSNLSGWMKGKTLLTITHRLTLLATMDRIIVLKDGRIAEQGTHASLLAHGGFYTQLWDAQDFNSASNIFSS